MHRIESRTYVGEPGETVTVATTVTGGGQASVIVDGVDSGPQAQFPLPPNPGDRIKWQIALMGPLGATCVVDIRVVDGGSDQDFLICQAHNPAPVHFYTCSVVHAPALRGLTGARAASVRKAVTRRATTPRTSKSTTTKNVSVKSTRRKAATRKSGARKTRKTGGRS